MTIRPFTKSDRQAVLQLIRLNIPQFFAEEEELEFATYLDKGIEDYFVVAQADKIIGCGGINYAPEQKEAIISWDMIHPDQQGRGIGKALLKHRLRKIKEDGQFDTIRVRTSQFAFGFYEQADFKLHKIESDYWGKGFDLYEMTKEL